MTSIQDIMKELAVIKEASLALSNEMGASNIELANQASRVANLVNGSSSGQDAVLSLSSATRSVSDMISSLNRLSSTCEECISVMQK